MPTKVAPTTVHIGQTVEQTINNISTFIIPAEEVSYTSTPTENLIEKEEQPINYLHILLTVSILFSSLLLIRYTWNIYNIYRIGRKHKIPTHYNRAKIALIENLTTSHSFWNTIFLNKNDYEDQEIDSKILTHELVHVKQKHTADVLFIELLLVVFWFNPVLYLYRRAIKLNHEFLADEGVVHQSEQVHEYQIILLNQASGYNYSFASRFNYLITKKRLIMMTKKTP